MFINFSDRIEQMKTLKIDHDPLPWNWLTDRATFIREKIRAKWVNLLRDNSLKETTYQKFLADHAGFFLANQFHSFFILSQIRLGADLVTDFVVPSDSGSRGVSYELIEIESPHTPAFTAAGSISARLSTAMQQISRWKSWIKRNSATARDLFPCRLNRIGAEPYLSYTIIMGTQENSAAWLDDRNALSEQSGIQIRSFDYFTQRFDRNMFIHPFLLTCSSEEKQLPLEVRNELLNPFYIAYSDKEWRKVRKELSYSTHFVELNADILIKNRRYNEELLNIFVDYCIQHKEEAAADLHGSKV